MILHKVATASAKVEAEGERLFEQWTQNDESLEWRDYLLKYASEEALAYMREIEEVQAYADEHEVNI